MTSSACIVKVGNNDDLCAKKPNLTNTLDPAIIQILTRIQRRLEELNGLFKHGIVSTFISLFVTSLITLEISNGKQKTTIQDLLKLVKEKIDRLNLEFDKFYFVCEFEAPPLDVFYLKFYQFQCKIYKCLSLGDIATRLASHFVTLGKVVGHYGNLFVLAESYTKMFVDGLLLMDTDAEFEQKIASMRKERALYSTLSPQEQITK